jgi:alpha-D-ribose 1-methylphosphonate 5-triphosphate diphosphatase
MRRRSGEVCAATEKIAAQARAARIAMLSHDDTSPGMRMDYRTMGVRIAEFPLNWDTAEAAAVGGDSIVLGAPNVVRGGSHNGAISAEEAIRRGCCHILASDYYYPALLQAPISLVARGVCNWVQAWALVSSNPAAAIGLTDRGVIAEGRRADLVVLPEGRARPAMVMSGGRIVYREI